MWKIVGREINFTVLKNNFWYTFKSVSYTHLDVYKRQAFVGSYIHAGNKIAVLTALSASVAGDDEASRHVAMQAAEMNPIALTEAGVDASIIEKEIEIAKDQLRQEGKPEAMLDNIAKGKIQRFYKDNTLVNQDYIKDGSMSVAAYVKSVDGGLTVTGFKRVALG